MKRRFVILLLLAPLLISGCASTKTAAPVRESSYPPKRFPVAPAGFYRIQSGDTLFKIAFENGLDYRDLAAWNKLSDATYIRSGDLLKLHPPKAPIAAKVVTTPIPVKPEIVARVIPVDSVKTNVVKPEVVKPDVALASEQEDDAAPKFWVWPTRGVLLAPYGEGINKGIDMGGVRGSPIQAAAAGKIVYAGSGLRGYGKLIIIRHGKALLSAYAHATRILVIEGQKVTIGQPIAEMGDTDTDRVKLHFEIREYGKPVDPLNYLPKLG